MSEREISARQKSSLRAFRRVLGARVDTRPETLREYQTATFATRQKIWAVLRPTSVAQVQACLRLAQRHQVPVYPISRGMNWAYGCRVPVRTGAAVLDLSRLSRIRGLDEHLGVVQVQPGVTFRQLATYLRERRSSLMAPVVASTDLASVLGNALERGLCIGLGGVRADQTLSLEVVTATGERLRTGSAALTGSKTGALSRFGLGPSLDGLFFQSNLGVVTEATVWLQRRPRYRGGIEITLTPRRFAKAIEALRQAQESGELPGLVKISNATYDLLASYWDWSAQLPEGALLPSPVRPVNRTWRAELAVLGDTRAEAVDRTKWLRSRLRGLVDGYREQPLRKVRNPGTDPYLGGYNRSGIQPAYWKFPPPMPADIDLHRDQRGALFCSVSVPYRAKDLMQAAKTFEQTCLRHRFEAAMTFNAIDGRSVCFVGSLFFSRSERGEDERALACHAANLKGLAALGYLPFRLGIQSMDAMGTRAADTDRVLARIRRALDPAGVLAPGRYDGRSSK